MSDEIQLLKEELERKSQELLTLQEVSKLTTSTLDLEVMLDKIVNTVSKRMKTDICSIYLKDKDKFLVLSATEGLQDSAVGKVKLKIGEGIIGYTMKTGEPVFTSRADTHPHYLHVPETKERGNYSMLAVPLERDRISSGVICIQTVKARDYTNDEINFLTTIASLITGAIRNVQLYEEEKKALDEVSRLYKIGKAISSTLQLDRVLREITKAGAEVLDARGSILRLLDHERKNLEIQELYGVDADEHLPKVLELGESIAGQVAATKESILVTDVKTHPMVKSKFKKKVKSLVSVPILAKGDVIGTLSVFDKKEPVGRFTQDDERLLTILASQAGICIQNARLFDTLQKNEQQLRDIREQMLRVERLAAIGELSAKVAHEIRNPLVSIGGFARKAFEQLPEGDSGKQYLRIVLEEVSRLERILHEILDLSSPSLPRLKTMDLHQILEESLLMVRDLAKKHQVKIITKYDSSQSIVKVDREQLKQAFLNLLRNSIEAMEGIGGELKVHTYMAPQEKAKPDRVMLSIIDTGCGISTEQLAHIFDPFFSSKPKGSGLGLTITHKILVAHNASVNVESIVGRGTIFLIEFPLYKEKKLK